MTSNQFIEEQQKLLYSDEELCKLVEFIDDSIYSSFCVDVLKYKDENLRFMSKTFELSICTSKLNIDSSNISYFKNYENLTSSFKKLMRTRGWCLSFLEISHSQNTKDESESDFINVKFVYSIHVETFEEMIKRKISNFLKLKS